MDPTAVSNWIVTLVDRTRETADTLIPAGSLPGAGWVGLMLLAGGLLLGTYGARYAKGLLTIVLAGGGSLLGMVAARSGELNPLLGAAIGAAVLAILGYYTFRVWIGLCVGLLAVAVGLFIYGHDSLWPEFLGYNRDAALVQSGEVAYTLPSQADQMEFQSPSPTNYLTGFYHHLKDAQPRLWQHSTLLAILCLVVGFAFGTFGTRWALILSFAVVGTVLGVGGLGSFAEAFGPGGWEQGIAAHPKVTLGFVCAAFIFSLLLQIRMTQQQIAQQPPSEKPKK